MSSWCRPWDSDVIPIRVSSTALIHTLFEPYRGCGSRDWTGTRKIKIKPGRRHKRSPPYSNETTLTSRMPAKLM